MNKFLCATLVGVVMSISGMASAEDNPTGETGTNKAIANTNGPVLSMKHTGGWGAGVLGEFTLQKDGTFHWQSKKEDSTGTIPKAEADRLIKDVSSAGAGPAAEDAGYVQFKWIQDDGKAGAQDYSLPRQDPCRRLLSAVDALVRKYGKPIAEQGGGHVR